MFNKTKKKVNDWIDDVNGQYERNYPIIEKIETLLKEIVIIWEQDIAYREYNHKLMSLETKVYNFKNFNNFFKEYTEAINSDMFKNLLIKGYSEDNAKLGVIDCYLKKYNYELKKVEELIEFYNFLNEYQRSLIMLKNYKKTLIKENFIKIFNNCLLLNAYRKKYSELYNLIGFYEDVETILGPSGQYLREGKENSIVYVERLEELLTRIEIEKTKLEIRHQSLR